ncbi:MAG: YIP1 family protein, partial [Candidatus Micrarchaeota archaeon]
MDFNLWMKALTKPKETFAAQKAKLEFGVGVNFYAIALFVAGLISALSLFVFPTPGVGASASNLITVPIMNVIVGLIGAGISTGILWIIAMLLGGKGSFKQQFALQSLFA